ncbi:hypothetical protein BBP40_010648 [Aspergillus hancockii]|nr:hypothetical protein BBP40_010648 [Aspergillus hancockii]
MKDFRKLIVQAYRSELLVLRDGINLLNLARHTKPGGWVEFQDWDVNVYAEEVLKKPDLLLVQDHIWTTGSVKQGNIGVWHLIQADTGFEAGAMAVLTSFEGWSKKEVSTLVSQAKKDIRDPKIHTLTDL